MKYAFWGIYCDGALLPETAKIHRVFRRIQREQPSAQTYWAYSKKNLEAFAPDKLFLEPPPEGGSYPRFLRDFPCEIDYLEGWKND